MKRTALLCALVVITLTVGHAMAQQPAGPMHGHGMRQQSGAAGQTWMPPWLQNLPAEKQEAFKKIHETRSKTIYPLVMQFKAKKAQLMADLAQENVNRKAVDQTLSQMNDLHARIAREHVDLMLEIKNQFPEAPMYGMMMGPGMGMGGMGMGMMGHGMGMGRGMGMGHGMGMMNGYGRGGMGCPMMGGAMMEDYEG